MSDDEIERIVCAIDGLLARRFLLIVSTVVASILAVFVFGCAPAPEWSGKPDEVPMLGCEASWGGLKHRCQCADCNDPTCLYRYGDGLRLNAADMPPPIPELRCLGDGPPVRVDDDAGVCIKRNCFQFLNDRGDGKRWCQSDDGDDCEHSVWRCPVVVADREFNR